MTAEKLRARGIHRLVDVRAIDDHALREAVGSMADWLKQLANGIDDRPVVAHRETKSSGSENTYPEDLSDIDTIRKEIAEMAQHAVAWLERRALLGAHGHDKSSLLGFHHRHPQSYRRREPGCRRSVDTSPAVAAEDGCRTAAGQAAWRQRPQPLYGD